jgi:lysophospholipase L1-like esterase
MRSRRLQAALLPASVALAAAVLTACGSAGPPGPGKAADSAPPATHPSTPPTTQSSSPEPSGAPAGEDSLVYVAVGASETVGVGADRPSREAWPTVLHRKALADATYVNVGVSGSTVGEALAEQLPQALAARPDVVTVWLAVNDITHQVPVTAYEQQLRTLVHELRQDGRTRVLLGTVPAVQDLPAYRACLPGADPQRADVPCRLPIVPPEELVAATVADYNAAVHRVADAEGAEIVDLSARRNLTRLTGQDGFHPSTEGHRRIAAAFARALQHEES